MTFNTCQNCHSFLDKFEEFLADAGNANTMFQQLSISSDLNEQKVIDIRLEYGMDVFEKSKPKTNDEMVEASTSIAEIKVEQELNIELDDLFASFSGKY